jgi:hypothetical protein
MSGSAAERVDVVTASARSRPDLMYSIDDDVDSKRHLHLPAEQAGERCPPAPIRHVLHVDAGHHLEQLASDMGRAPDRFSMTNGWPSRSDSH